MTKVKLDHSFRGHSVIYPSNRKVINTPEVDLDVYDYLQAEDVIDKVVKEAISKPWLPLPIGLKPPATDSVLTELAKQGICTVPPDINGSDLR